MDPFFHTGLSISDSLKTVRKSVLIYETIIALRWVILSIMFLKREKRREKNLNSIFIVDI